MQSLRNMLPVHPAIHLLVEAATRDTTTPTTIRTMAVNQGTIIQVTAAIIQATTIRTVTVRMDITRMDTTIQAAAAIIQATTTTQTITTIAITTVETTTVGTIAGTIDTGGVISGLQNQRILPLFSLKLTKGDQVNRRYDEILKAVAKKHGVSIEGDLDDLPEAWITPELRELNQESNRLNRQVEHLGAMKNPKLAVRAR